MADESIAYTTIKKNEFKLSLIKSLNGIIIEYTCEYEIIFCVVCWVVTGIQIFFLYIEVVRFMGFHRFRGVNILKWTVVVILS